MSDLIQTVAKFAPVVGTALGGPFGGAIGTLIATAFNGDVADQKDLINKINNDPDAKFKLLALEGEIKLESEKLQNEMAQAVLTDNREREAIAIEDRKNARKRETDLASTGNKDYMSPILALSTVIGFYCLLTIIINNPKITENQIIAMVIGMLVAEFKNLMAYHFGSSVGSRRKDETINKMT